MVRAGKRVGDTNAPATDRSTHRPIHPSTHPPPYQSAHAGNIDAQVMLAECHLKGIGCKADIPAAVFWYEKAAVCSGLTPPLPTLSIAALTRVPVLSKSCARIA